MAAIGDYARIRPRGASPRARVEDVVGGRVGTIRALLEDYAGEPMAVVDLHLREEIYGPLPTLAARASFAEQRLVVVPQAALEVTTTAPHRSRP